MMARNLVGITLYLDPALLSEINSKIHGKSQSEKIRRLLGFGYELFTLQQQCAERNDIIKPQDNPHNIALFYTTEGDFVTVTLDLSQSKISLFDADLQSLNELHLITDKCILGKKKVVLVTIRDVLVDATTLIMEILASHIKQGLPK
jgi:hypothetical protein